AFGEALRSYLKSSGEPVDRRELAEYVSASWNQRELYERSADGDQSDAMSQVEYEATEASVIFDREPEEEETGPVDFASPDADGEGATPFDEQQPTEVWEGREEQTVDRSPPDAIEISSPSDEAAASQSGERTFGRSEGSSSGRGRGESAGPPSLPDDRSDGDGAPKRRFDGQSGDTSTASNGALASERPASPGGSAGASSRSGSDDDRGSGARGSTGASRGHAGRSFEVPAERGASEGANDRDTRGERRPSPSSHRPSPDSARTPTDPAERSGGEDGSLERVRRAVSKLADWLEEHGVEPTAAAAAVGVAATVILGGLVVIGFLRGGAAPRGPESSGAAPPASALASVFPRRARRSPT
ncbi:MAG: hypothetical protein ABEL76_12890, partial [Bradymonadaceae bacterium]